ncbi:hypothetical protein [Myxococcus faecalis]
MAWSTGTSSSPSGDSAYSTEGGDVGRTSRVTARPAVRKALEAEGLPV